MAVWVPLGLWLAWISPSAQPWTGPVACLAAGQDAGCSLVKQHSVCFACKFYWCGLAFWLIGELMSSKAIFCLFWVCVELLHGFDCGVK